MRFQDGLAFVVCKFIALKLAVRIMTTAVTQNPTVTQNPRHNLANDTEEIVVCEFLPYSETDWFLKNYPCSKIVLNIFRS